MNALASSDNTAGPGTRSRTRVAAAVARYLLGVPMAVFGLNAFLNFIPPPSAPLPAGAAAFAGALAQSGYMMPLIGTTQLLVGLLLVVNRFVPLAVILYLPFLVNSVAFHLFLQPGGLPMALFFHALALYLAWTYRRVYAPLLAARATPV